MSASLPSCDREIFGWVRITYYRGVTRDRSNRWQDVVALPADEEASLTCDYCVANSATPRAARPNPSAGKNARLGMTSLMTSSRLTNTWQDRTWQGQT